MKFLYKNKGHEEKTFGLHYFVYLVSFVFKSFWASACLSQA